MTGRAAVGIGGEVEGGGTGKGDSVEWVKGAQEKRWMDFWQPGCERGMAFGAQIENVEWLLAPKLRTWSGCWRPS